MDNGGDILQLCRLCLVKDDVNIPIFEEQGDIRQIFLKISSCLPVKVSREDKLPKKICDGCSYKLDMLYEFWNTTANAEKQLLSWLGEAGMNAKMADGTISAVAQQIKPVETFVKQEAIDPSDIHTEDNDDDKSYMFQQKFAVEEAGPSATVTSNEEEPPPKRQRRTAAVKAQIAMDPESDDDDDSGEPITKVEDESEESDGDDHEPPFVDVPSTSADDQPGPSGVGKDGVEAPSKNSSRKLWLKEQLKKYNITKELVIQLEDVTLSEKLDEDTVTLSDERRKQFTCYICMANFSSAKNMAKHKALHGDSDFEDDIFEEDISQTPSPTYSPEPNRETEDVNKACDNTETVTKEIQKVTSPEPSNDTEDVNNKSCDNTEAATKETEKITTSFKCETCNVFFESSHDAKLHKVSNKCKFSCRICGRKFNMLYAFVVHVMQHKSDTTKNQNLQMVYTCPTCGKSFFNCILLRSHEIEEHTVKLNDAPKNDDTITNINGEETTTLVKVEPLESSDQALTSDTNQLKEICCDLCYDVFDSEEELKAHMEFHEQLEDNSNSIVIEDDEEEVVEVYEEKKDPHEIITTIKSTTKPLRKKTATKSVHPNPPTTTSNHILTDAIKDMLTPRTKKQSKTIVLPSDEAPRLIPINILKKSTGHNLPVTTELQKSNLELRKTGPFSFALQFKEGDSSSPGTSSNSTVGVHPSRSVGLSSSSTLTTTVPLYVSSLINPMSIQTSSSIGLTNTSTLSSTVPIFATSLINSVGVQTSSRIGLTNTSTLPSTVPLYAQALINTSLNPVTSSPGVSGNVTNNPNLQLFISSAPYVPGFQGLPAGSVIPTVTNNNVAKTTSTLTSASTSTSASNLTYVVTPSPIFVNDPKKGMAYVILPHGNNCILNQLVDKKDPTKVVPQQIQPKQPTVTDAKATTQNSTTAIIITSTTTNVSSCVPTTSTTKQKKNVPIASGTIESPAASTTSSSANTSKPSIATKAGESIVIDSDSSNEEESTINNTGNDSESDELVIDESSSTPKEPSKEKSTEGTESGEKPETPKKKYKFPSQCDGCSVIFYRMKSMRNHLERRYRCQMCEYRCCKVSDFKHHYILEHRKFFCSRCSFLAHTKRTFTDHNRANHICLTCNGFYSNLKYHVCHKAANTEKNGDGS